MNTDAAARIAALESELARVREECATLKGFLNTAKCYVTAFGAMQPKQGQGQTEYELRNRIDLFLSSANPAADTPGVGEITR